MSALTKTLLAATAASALSGLLPAYAYDHAECSAQRGCAAKICHLERELSYARAHNNSHRVAGLQRALAETKAHCTDSRLEAERAAGRAERIVQSQIEKSLPDDADPSWLTLAYEPRWAIGTGKTPTPDEIASMHAILRAKLRMMIGEAKADGIRILYGGSVTGANAAQILALDNVDGALVGGASLTAEKFVPIIRGAASVS